MSADQAAKVHKLSALNSATLGAEFPEVTLPDGSKVQTGTVGALLTNVKKYDTLNASLHEFPRLQSNDDTSIKEQMDVIDTAFVTAMPLLFKVGMFDLFKPDEWIEGSKSAGRKRVGELAIAWQQEKETGKGST